MLEQSFETNGLTKGDWHLNKLMQMHDMILVHNGIIVLGEKNAGKTASIRILETAINKSSENEYQDKLQELRE